MSEKCVELKDSLLDFVYGETESPEKEAEIRSHIEECAECMRLVKEYRSVNSAMKGLRVDFSEDVWKMQRESIIRKVRKQKAGNPLRSFIDFIKGSVTVKRAGLAFLLLVAVGAGLQYYGSYRQELRINREKAITEKLEFYENIQILERLDFYKTLTEEGVLL